ncbi:MAG: hypothetical protein LBR22_01370 [Desulfovibrio sp.]|nr:hypothetical protein [Desulfovibrio sp.]
MDNASVDISTAPCDSLSTASESTTSSDITSNDTVAQQTKNVTCDNEIDVNEVVDIDDDDDYLSGGYRGIIHVSQEDQIALVESILNPKPKPITPYMKKVLAQYKECVIDRCL